MRVISDKMMYKYNSMSVVSKATIWFMVCSVIQKGLSFITTPIFTRLMTQEQFGVYSVYMSWVQILTIVSSFRLDYSVFNKGMSKYPEDRDGYTSSMLGLTSVITTVLFILYLCFHKKISAVTELSQVIMIAIFVELFSHLAISFWSLRERYEFRYKAVVFFTVIMAIVSSVAGVVSVALAEDKGTARILSNVIVYASGGIVLYYIIFKRGKKFFDKEYAKFAIVFNIPLIPHYFSTYLIEQSDRIMIQKLVNFEAAALYSVAYTVGGIIKIFTAALTNTLIPLQYRLLEKKNFKQLNRTIQMVMITVAALVVLLSAAGPEVVYILGGSEYMVAQAVIPPVAASVFFSFLYTLLANIEFFFEANKFAMKISFVGAAVNVVLNFLLIPSFGFVVAAYTTLVSYIIYAAAHMLYVNYLIKKSGEEQRINNQMLFFLSIVSTVLCLIISVFYQNLLVRICIVFAICLAAFIKRKSLFALLKKDT